MGYKNHEWEKMIDYCVWASEKINVDGKKGNSYCLARCKPCVVVTANRTQISHQQELEGNPLCEKNIGFLHVSCRHY